MKMYNYTCCTCIFDFVFSAWVPYIRDGNHASSRHMGVYFGNVTTVTMVDIQQDTTEPDEVTEITIEYTNDGIAYFGAETVSTHSFVDQFTWYK